MKLSFRRGLNVDEVKCGSYQQRASRLKDATMFALDTIQDRRTEQACAAKQGTCPGNERYTLSRNLHGR